MSDKKSAYQMTTPEQAPLFMCAGKENAGKVPKVDANGFITEFTDAGGGSTHNPTFTGLLTADNMKLKGDFVCEDGASFDFTGATIEGVGLVKTTYADLKDLRDDGKLVAGTYYRITDYVATTTQANTQSANHPFDIIVVAVDESNFSKYAYAIQHSGDTYFSTSDLLAWEIWYSFDNDTNAFAWADSANGKGVIYKMTDEYQNTAYYDFKGIQVKNTSSSDRFYYLFDNSEADASINSTSAFPNVYSNRFGMYVISNKMKIGCNVLKGTKFYSNIIRNNFINNTIGNWFCGNTIENDFNNNTIGDSFYNNTTGNNFCNNNIGNYFYSNTIGTNFYNNTIGNSFANNTTGNNFCNNNTTGLSTQPTKCDFSSGIDNKITTSTTTWTNNRTYYIGSDGTLKMLN